MRISEWSSDVCSSDLAVDARHADRNFETEILIHPEFRIVQATIKRRIEQRARNLDGHTAADTIFAARPAGIDQPARNAALGDPLFQRIAVNRRMAWQDRKSTRLNSSH